MTPSNPVEYCARGRSGSGTARAPCSPCRAGSPPWRAAGSARHGMSIEKPRSSPRAVSQALEVVGRRSASTARWRPRRGSASSSGTSRSGSTSSRVPMPVHSGQAPNGAVERERPRLDLVEGRAGGRSGRPGSRRTVAPGRGPRRLVDQVDDHEPPARRSAVSTESVSRRCAAALGDQAVDDDLDGVLELLLQLRRLGEGDAPRRPPARGRSPWTAAHGTGRRTRPCAPRTTGASTWNRVPSGSSSSRSTICCGVCRVIASPQIGQCGLPTRAHSRRR